MEQKTPDAIDIRSIIRGAIEEFVKAEQAKAEPAYKAELLEEKKRREELEYRMNELVQENRRAKEMANEADKNASIRSELQRLGVAKIDLAFRAVRDEIQRTEDGRLIARDGSSEMPLREYLAQFVNENPELLPARMSGGSGAGPLPKTAPASGGLDLDKIRPGMSAEELDKMRQEIARVASQTLRGL